MSVIDLSEGAFTVGAVETMTSPDLSMSCNGCGATVCEMSGDDGPAFAGLGALVLAAGAHIGQCHILSGMVEVKL